MIIIRYNTIIDNATKEIALEFILECPASIKNGNQYFPVSARNCSFRERGISKSLLRTILSQVKNTLPNRERYIKLNATDDVQTALKTLENNNSLSDPVVEYIVLKGNATMTESESVFYYIRNAFAHGSFRYDIHNSTRYYTNK